MRVRLKEFLWHIIIMLIVFVYMLITSLLYTSYVDKELSSSSALDAASYATGEVANINNSVSKILNAYYNGTVGSDIYTKVNVSDATINDKGYYLSYDATINDIYCYIKLNKTSDEYLRVTLSQMFNYGYTHSTISNLDSLVSGLVGSDGTIYYLFKSSNVSAKTLNSLFDSTSEYCEKLKNYTNPFSSELTSLSNNDTYYLASSLVSNDIFYFEAYNTNMFKDRVSQNNTLALVYRTAIFIGFVIMLLDILFIVIRSNRIVKVRRNTAAKEGCAVITINKKGKVKFYAKGRDTFGKEVTNLKKTFSPVSGNLLEEELKQKSRFICTYSLNDSTEYAEFISIPQRNGYTVIANVITDEYKHDTELKKITEYNSITGLPNRATLIKEFDELKKKFLKKDVTLVRLKIVEFEYVSKTLGYKAGDKLLESSIDLIKQNSGEEYYIYQDENDTLLILLCSNFNENNKIVESYLDLFTRPISVGSSKTFVHLKIGTIDLTNAVNNNFKINDALDKSIIALSRAIEQVSVNIVKYDKNLENYIEYKKQMEEDMHKAIDSGEFVMYYQAQYNLKEKRIEGFESLIRWNSTKYKGVSPQVYIELAEKNGDIVDIGRFINKSVFKAAQVFQNFDVTLSINVSPAQLMQSGFIDELLNEYKKNDLRPGSICVEITETYVMQNFTSVVEKLNLLKAAGFKIHLDDFGSGYSSMMYLKELPCDTIKTDMAFIKNLETDKDSQVIESTIINLAHNLGLKVIVEGVERESQVELLEEYGADNLQGYLISRPIPEDKALELLKEGVKIKTKGGNN